VNKPSFCLYVSIAKILQSIFNHKWINKIDSDYVNEKVSGGVFRDILYGKVYKEN
jgi:hypothetical protein